MTPVPRSVLVYVCLGLLTSFSPLALEGRAMVYQGEDGTEGEVGNPSPQLELVVGKTNGMVYVPLVETLRFREQRLPRIWVNSNVFGFYYADRVPGTVRIQTTRPGRVLFKVTPLPSPTAPPVKGRDVGWSIDSSTWSQHWWKHPRVVVWTDRGGDTVVFPHPTVNPGAGGNVESAPIDVQPGETEIKFYLQGITAGHAWVYAQFYYTDSTAPEALDSCHCVVFALGMDQITHGVNPQPTNPPAVMRWAPPNNFENKFEFTTFLMGDIADADIGLRWDLWSLDGSWLAEHRNDQYGVTYNPEQRAYYVQPMTGGVSERLAMYAYSDFNQAPQVIGRYLFRRHYGPECWTAALQWVEGANNENPYDAVKAGNIRSEVPKLLSQCGIKIQWRELDRVIPDSGFLSIESASDVDEVYHIWLHHQPLCC